MLIKKEVKICMGSSCFSRGNKKILQVIQKFISEHDLEDRIDLKGNHCFSDCNKGPIVKIGSKIYENIDHMKILEVLEQEFGSIK